MADTSQPDVASVMAALSEPSDDTSNVPHGGNADVASVLSALQEKAPAPAAQPAAAQTATAKPLIAPTRRAMARAPIAEETPEPSWSEVGQSAARNLIPSVGNVFSSMGQAVLHPRQTLSALGDLAEGAVSQAAGKLGVQQDPAEKAKTEQMLNMLEEQYKRTYGTMKGFKKALAEDPASVMMDLSTVLTGGASVAGKMAATGSKAARAAEIAGKVGSAIDPVGQALNLAKGVAKGPIALGRYAQYAATGVPKPLLEVASEAGRTSNPVLRDTFQKFYKGEGTAEEFQTAAQRALSGIKNDASKSYLSSRKGLQNSQIDFSDIYDTLNKVEQEASRGSALGWQERRAAIQQMRDMVDDVYTHPNPAKRGLENVDALKQQIYEVGQQIPTARGAVGEVYGSVRNSLANPALGGDAKYAQLMEKYQEGLNSINSLTKDLGLGNKTAANAAVLKSLKAMKTPHGENVFKQLAEKDPRLAHMLSGMALSPLTAGGARNILEYMSSAPLLMMGRPDLAIGQFVASSPKIAGAVNYAAGKAGKYGNMATSPAVRVPAYIGAVAQEGEPQAAAAPQAVEPSNVAQRIREVEGTGKNPMSSARGPYQFIDSTFVDMFRKMYPDQAVGMSDEEIKQIRNTPEGEKLQEQMGPALIDENSNILRQSGKEPTAGNIYLMHFLGPRDAMKVLNSDPSSPVDRLLSNPVIAANRRLLEGKTAGEVVAEMERMMTGAATGGRIERASGGRVHNVDSLVDDLMGKFRKAKKETDKTTEPLLNAPDEHIVKALDVAQQAI